MSEQIITMQIDSTSGYSKMAEININEFLPFEVQLDEAWRHIKREIIKSNAAMSK